MLLLSAYLIAVWNSLYLNSFRRIIPWKGLAISNGLELQSKKKRRLKCFKNVAACLELFIIFATANKYQTIWVQPLPEAIFWLCYLFQSSSLEIIGIVTNEYIHQDSLVGACIYFWMFLNLVVRLYVGVLFSGEECFIVYH